MSNPKWSVALTMKKIEPSSIHAKPRVLSGIQPSGQLHIGNLFGALKPWVVKQEEYQNFFCIVDLHAVTVPQKPEQLHKRIRQLAALYLAAGIDTDRSVIFVQSRVRAHAELAWLLGCVTPSGWLHRMTQYKSKARGGSESTSTGLFTYPVLMAADILAYQADYVPVGDDQKQHLELTRDIAARFNQTYGNTLNVPRPLIGHTGAGARIMGLDDPNIKMSKSSQHSGHAVNLLDSPDVIRRKVRRANTDSGKEVEVKSADGGVANLIEIYRCATGISPERATSELDGIGYGQLKNRVADALIETVTPLQMRYSEYEQDHARIELILAEGTVRATEVADKTAEAVRARMGIG